jgi:sulfite dehydrogenase (cytochrome) subunit A
MRPNLLHLPIDTLLALRAATGSSPRLRRRDFLHAALLAVGAASARIPLAFAADVPATAPTNHAAKRLMRFPEKTDLILLTDRPPNLETPLRYFRHDLTPNDAFFVRWHLSGIPTSVDLQTFRLAVSGHVEKPLKLSLEDLKSSFDPVSIVAVNQCSGNSRSFYEPRVNGGQWGHGAVGNARWTGVRLRDILQRAGIKDGAVDVSFAGLDRGITPDVPQFVKSLSIEKAMDGDVMVAYAMNDAPLPMLNGFPFRLVVPGWFGTYWVKSLSDINVLADHFKGFWMDKAYRIPNVPDAQETPQKLATDTVPISSMSVRSLFVRPESAQRLERETAVEVEGLAFDGGHGIRKVEVSLDGGTKWRDAQLDPEIGKFSWRRWRTTWQPQAAGSYRLMARATNVAGQTQTSYQWNRSGYQRNVIEQVDVTVA